MRIYARWFQTALMIALALAAAAASAAAATLKISSFPSGAHVLVDGVNTGKVTPMNVSLPEGEHVVTVQIPNSGWNSDTRTVSIVSGNNDLSVTLLPIPTPGPPGPPGIQGPMGDTGPTGPQGPPGESSITAPTVTEVPVQSPFEDPSWHLLHGSQDYGALETTCVDIPNADHRIVGINVRIRNSNGFNHHYTVAGNLLGPGDGTVSPVSFRLDLGAFQRVFLGRVELLDTHPWTSYDFTVMRFANGPDEYRVLSSAHVAIGFDASTAGICRISTVTKAD